MKIFVSRVRAEPTGAGPTIDMTPDGQFIETRKPRLVDRVFGSAILAAVIFGGLAVAALMLWLALALIPIALGAAALAWGAFRFRLWRRGSGSVGGQRYPTRT